MDTLVKSVGEYIRRHQLLAGGETVVVGVSGGIDSMVLLHVLHRLAPRLDLKLVIAHVNHGLRGRESDQDERFVAAAAKALGLPLRSLQARVRQTQKRGESIEMAARRVRHGFLFRVQQQRKARAIALAHHADDQVELFFLRLFRGAGGAGLAGMEWTSPSPAGKGGQIIRPLLHCSRDAIEAYATRTGLKWRTDASNEDTTIVRNRIRHDLLPLLRRSYCAGLNAVILRTMEILGGDAACANVLGELVERSPSLGEQLPAPISRHLESLAARRSLELKGAPVSYAAVQRHRRQSRGQAPPKDGRKAPGFRRGSKQVELDGECGHESLAGLELDWWIRLGAIPFDSVSQGLEQFDADKLGRAIQLRHWRAGDRFQPLGMPSPVKLQDQFVNRKIPALERRSRWLAVAEDGNIFWVQGLPPGDRYKVTSRTSRVLCLQGKIAA